jgi:hypothetical protein
MLDAPFNHTSYDCELASQGVSLIKPGVDPLTQTRNAEARFFSHGDLFNIANNNYCIRASSASDIAPLAQIESSLAALFAPGIRQSVSA